MNLRTKTVRLTDGECDLVYRALGVVSEALSLERRTTSDAVRKLAFTWTNEALDKVRQKFAPKQKAAIPATGATNAD